VKEHCPSETAIRVAVRRAAHQILDNPKVLEDPIALKMASVVGSTSDGYPSTLSEDTLYAKVLRASLVARSRYAEDELHRAIQRGIHQYVVLGAGLDTFAYRHVYPRDVLHVFEVDHPATQAWKRAHLTEVGIPIPETLTFAAMDFETQTLVDGLRQAGLDTAKSTFFSWLGVTPYLTASAITDTLHFVSSMPVGSGIVFDYMISPVLLDSGARLSLDALSLRVAQAGEPFRSFFDPSALAASLKAMGFGHIENIDPEEMNSRYFRGRQDKLRVGRLSHIMNAQV
jgi:methyltransferase (TIGR00027 family)